MPKGKAIYDDLMKNYSKRRKDKDERRKNELDENGKPKPPPSVSNYDVNKARVARSLNTQPAETIPERKMSPAEGKPTVNANPKTEPLIHKPKPKTTHPLEQPEAGAISQATAKSAKKKVKARSAKKTVRKSARKATETKSPKNTDL